MFIEERFIMNKISKNKRKIPVSLILVIIITILLCIAFAFAYARIYNVSEKSIITGAEDRIDLISENTNSFIQKAETVVETEAGEIEYLIKQGEDNDRILDVLLYDTNNKISKVDKNFTGVYGYYRGEYLDGNGWDPYADGGTYEPKKRPWYKAGAEGKGEVSAASPYLDMDTGNVVLSVTKLLSDGESVVGLDISLESLSKYLTEYMTDNDFGYAYIIDNRGTIVASKNQKDVGKNYIVKDIYNDSLGLGEMFKKTLKSDDYFEYDINGQGNLVFSRTIENGWQVILLRDSHNIYSSLRKIAAMCIILLAALIGVTAFFLINSIRENRLIREAQEKEHKYLSDLKDYTYQLESYKRAILSDALISLEVNLNTDKLIYGVWKDDNGNKQSLSDILGLDTPCSYDEYISRWNRKFVQRASNESFSNTTNRQNLIETFNKGVNEVTFDYEAETISGRRTWLRRSICMTENQKGEIIAYTSVKDISALLETKKREEAYVAALSSEFDSIVVVHFNDEKTDDQVSIHSRISDNLRKIINTETIREKYFSRKLDMLSEFVHEDDKVKFINETRREHIMAYLENGSTEVVNFRLADKEGEEYYYQLHFVPLKTEEDELFGMIACMRSIDDEIKAQISNRKELEEAKIAAEAANQAKTTFLFNMSHDIRTPMNAIIGFTDMAAKNVYDAERVEECLSKVKLSSEHLLSLINDVLDMSRVEAGKMSLDVEPVFIDTAMNNVQSIMFGNAEAKNISLTFNIDSDIEHHWIYSDRTRTMRVLTNIISNSVKYTEPGGRIDVSVCELPCEEKGYALHRYTVADTGIGMSEEFLSTIFDPFTRAESATKSGVTGTGLGMSITKSLVELMGGTIDITSKLGEGTTVIIDFESRISEEEHPEEAIREYDMEILHGKKVLLVEDNELNREIATDILEEEGMIVYAAEDGDIAVDMMKNASAGEYDLVLMDIQMPTMNGYDATRAIRSLPDKDIADIPIIAMTANAFEEDKRDAAAAGMNGHIAKPIDVPLLIQTLSELFV